jgi:hypothetical protein
MNDYVIYEGSKQRYADLIDEVRRSRACSSRGYQGSWTSVTTHARQRLAVVVHGLTNWARTPSVD